MKILILILVLSFTINQSELLSQNKCNTYEYLQMQNQNETIRQNRQLLETKIQEFLKNSIQQRSINVYTIQVVFHIVMQNPNDISFTQIQSQLEILNQDFRALNSDVSSVPTAFQNLVSDSKFEFILANVGPNCNGITRTTTNVNCFDDQVDNIKRTSAGGHDPIDPLNLLNIWVGPICNASGPIRGYAQLPGGPLATDGVALAPDVFGTSGTVLEPYDLGRTATHEIGHYFNLNHIWGDDGSACTGSDHVEDTPNQGGSHFGCPDFPSVSCQNGPNGDLFMNFMDYVDDGCMHMFTVGQSARMNATLLTTRQNLIDPYVCCPGTINTPILSTYNITVSCPFSGINLNALHIGTIPSGATLIWSPDADPTDGISPQINPLVYSLGTYYAYYFNEAQFCYGPGSQGVELTHPLSNDIHISINTPYNSNKEIFGNLYIENGATLTITSTITFGPDSKIIVESNSKLLVDGGTLTACAPKWQGVNVAGEVSIGFYSQLPGEVELKNSAIIEKAVTGIDGTDLFSYSGLTFEHGGGIINIDNSTIQNCNYGIKLAPYGWGPIIGLGTSGEQSLINQSTIQDCETGIYSDGNIGLEITKSTFANNYNDYMGFGSTIIAEDNTFTSVLLMYANFPSLPGSTFESNTFIDNYLETQSQGNFTTFKVEKNSFLGAGFIALGELMYEIRGNDYYDSYQGNGTGDTGENILNIIGDNAFYNNKFANTAWGVNNVYFFTNCFENSDFTDIELYHGASIAIEQGVQNLSAGNCFAAGARVETGTETEHFTYWTKDGYNFPQNCKHPGNGNFTIRLAQNEASQDECGTGIELTDLPAIYRDCECYHGDDGCKVAIEAIRDELDNLENNHTIDPQVKSWLIEKYKQCIDKLMRVHLQSSLARGEVEETITYLSTQPEFRYKIMAYGIMNHNRDYNASKTYLNSLTTNTQEQIDFVATQNIYLDYITDLDGFVLSISDYSILENAGYQENELAGYARSIYYRLTGNKIEIDLPHLNGTITPRNSEKTSSLTENKLETSKAIIYPNPVDNDFFEITIKDYDPDKVYSINIYDLFGRHTTSKQLASGHESIIMEEYPGIYFATILADGHIVSNQN